MPTIIISYQSICLNQKPGTFIKLERMVRGGIGGIGRWWWKWRLFFLGFILFLGVGSCLGNQCPPPETIMPCRCRGRNDQVQVWCSHSDLERVNGALENLMRLRSMPAIDELIVENNKMPTLMTRSFGALKIRRLLLRNNGLESLSRNAFAGLEDSLEEIYMVEDKLVDFPFDSIEKLRNLEAFTVEKSRMRLLPSFNGLSRLKHIRIDGSSISALPVGAFSAMSAIKQIHITNSKVDRLAEGIFGRLDSLLLANFSGNRIDHVQRRCFALLPRLEVLSVGGNRLSDAATVGRSMEELTSLKSLDLSNNQFKDLPEGSFVNLRSLQFLNLGGNQISRVATRSFTHLPALRKVDLSNNLLRKFPKQLFDTTPLLEELRMRKNQLGSSSEIGELLSSLKSLRYVDLSGNGITDLPSNTIRDHTQLQTLDLSDNLITRLQRSSFLNLPSLVELSLKNNSLSLVDNEAWDITSLKELDLSHNSLVEIGPSTLKGLNSLARLDLSHNGLKALSGSIFGQNPHLEFMSLSENQIGSIFSEAFYGLTTLQKLDLSRNHVTMLASGTFRSTLALVSLNLSNNRINSIPADLLSNLKLLQELNLKSNSLSYIPTGFFSSLSSLRDLNLKHNTLGDLNSRLFAGLSKLEQLRLSSNQIRIFDEVTFDNLMSLRGLDLSSNRISKLPSRSLRNLPALEKLEARENRITVVENGVLADTEGLQILDLAHNALTSLPVELLKSNSLLKVVDLSHNEINKVEKDAFTQLGGLMELYLNDNKISSIPRDTISNLSSLTIVDLDGNDIVEIGTETFAHLPRLIYLRLSRNRVKRVARGGFSNLLSLDGLDLFMNELEEISPGAFLKTGALKYLNLSHNNLDSMKSMGIEALGSLEVLDISYNKLSIVDTDALRHLIWLVELRMNDNGLCFIPPGTFDGMSRLKMLVLRNNRLRHLFESVFYKLRNNIAFMDVAGNPLNCDCEMTWLRNLVVREELQELSDSSCDTPSELKGVAMKSARPGQMICSGGKRSSNFLPSSSSSYSDGDPDQIACPPLTQSKRKPRPSSISVDDRPALFGSNLGPDDFYTGGDQSLGDLRHNNRRKDEKQLMESNDFVSGDTPTIYAGSSASSSIASSTKATQYNNGGEVPKSGGSGGVLSSIFGIPIDFGFNFGISPAFSWADKDNKKVKRPSKSGGGVSGASSPISQDPLPPNWLHRTPSTQGGNMYEAPEYLPRKPNQPYIPLSDGGGGSSVEPSGSVEVHKAILPGGRKKTSPSIKFPAESTSTKKSPSSWRPDYNPPPNTETGFIPIEPFFHGHNTKNTIKIPPPPKSDHEDRTHIDPPKQPEDEDSSPPSEESDEGRYTPIKVQTTEGQSPSSTTSSSSSNKGDVSLSDFWNIFSSGSGSSTSSSTTNGVSSTSTTTTHRSTTIPGHHPQDNVPGPEEQEVSYEEEEEEANSSTPFNFSAPVDAPLPIEPEEEAEYNIPFGEPVRVPIHQNHPHRVTGRPTITKIVESDPPSFHPIKPNQVSYNEIDEGVQGVPSEEDGNDGEADHPLEKPPPLIPPVIIGDSSAEPRDWYYTNYHKTDQEGGGIKDADKVLERLRETSNKLRQQGDNTRSRSVASNPHLTSYLLSLYSLLIVSLFIC